MEKLKEILESLKDNPENSENKFLDYLISLESENFGASGNNNYLKNKISEIIEKYGENNENR